MCMYGTTPFSVTRKAITCARDYNHCELEALGPTTEAHSGLCARQWLFWQSLLQYVTDLQGHMRNLSGPQVPHGCVLEQPAHTRSGMGTGRHSPVPSEVSDHFVRVKLY